MKGIKLGLEIEEKFLLSALPTNIEKSEKHLVQYYLFVDESFECRIRLIFNGKTPRYILGFKIGKGKVRIEDEHEIPKQVFEELKKKCLGCIDKFRYEFIDNDQKWVIDQFISETTKGWGLILAETEFERQGELYTVPTKIEKVLIKQVTYDESYKNKNLILRSK